MTTLVSFPIIFPWFFDVSARRNRIFTAMFGDILPDGSSSVGFVGKDVTAGNVHFLQQFHGNFGVIGLTAGQNKIDDLTGTVDQSMNFCVLSTTACADILPVFRVYSPFFAPALCG